MCGIHVEVSRLPARELLSDVVTNLKARGPDHLATYFCRTSSTEPHSTIERTEWCLTFTSSVLSLRGDHVHAQPIIDPQQNHVLCWNGEAWKMQGLPVRGNDSVAVMNLLLRAVEMSDARPDESQERSATILNALTHITGPYAFVFFDSKTSILYYGRDRLGRRSLMFDVVLEDSSSDMPARFTISSLDTTLIGSATEVTTDGVHYIDLARDPAISKIMPWPNPVPALNKIVPPPTLEISPAPTESAIDALRVQLTSSIRLRVLDVSTYNVTDVSHSHPSRVAILFSGGLDCTLLARICHDVLSKNEPIDLLNVAFENPRTIKAAMAAATGDLESHSLLSHFERCPDRITGRSSFNELKEVCHDRLWRFVAVDVPYREVQEYRSTIIRLMRPHNTEMDLSIAMALFFAARGKGTAHLDQSFVQAGSETAAAYATTARVLLSGLGADELFGGYSRHAAAFARGSFEALNDELELDFTRIGTRNLGRDDRVMAHWSREVRYPFLDEDFVAFTLSLPAWEKVGFRPNKKVPRHFEEHTSTFIPSLDRDGSDSAASEENLQHLDPTKLILRCLMWQLGMKHAACEKKRAIQFGARTAKMEGGRTKGTDVLSPDLA